MPDKESSKDAPVTDRLNSINTNYFDDLQDETELMNPEMRTEMEASRTTNNKLHININKNDYSSKKKSNDLSKWAPRVIETSRGTQKTMYLGDFLKEIGINKIQRKYQNRQPRDHDRKDKTRERSKKNLSIDRSDKNYKT